MTHDPMCSIAGSCKDNEEGGHWLVREVFCEWCWERCQCQIIAKVRADTLKRVEAQITLCYLLAMRDYKRTSGAFNQGEIQAYETCQEIIDSLRENS